MASDVKSPLALEPMQGGQCAVIVVAKDVGVSWLLRIPEALDCEEGVFKVHEYPLIHWEGPDGDGVVRSAWTSSEADFERISRYDRAEEFGLRFAQGIAYELRIVPDEDGVVLRFSATNTTSERSWHNVLANPCLGRPTSSTFEDLAMTRTFMTSDGRLVPMSEVDGGSGDPIRGHFDLAGSRPKRWFAEPFWGLPSATLSTDGTIFRTDAKGRHTIVFRWTKTGGLFHNEDAHHCIHSVAAIGDLEPGESRTVLRKIVLVDGDVSEAHRLLTEALRALSSE